MRVCGWVGVHVHVGMGVCVGLRAHVCGGCKACVDRWAGMCMYMWGWVGVDIKLRCYSTFKSSLEESSCATERYKVTNCSQGCLLCILILYEFHPRVYFLSLRWCLYVYVKHIHTIRGLF